MRAKRGARRAKYEVSAALLSSKSRAGLATQHDVASTDPRSVEAGKTPASRTAHAEPAREGRTRETRIQRDCASLRAGAETPRRRIPGPSPPPRSVLPRVGAVISAGSSEMREFALQGGSSAHDDRAARSRGGTAQMGARWRRRGSVPDVWANVLLVAPGAAVVGSRARARGVAVGPHEGLASSRTYVTRRWPRRRPWRRAVPRRR